MQFHDIRSQSIRGRAHGRLTFACRHSARKANPKGKILEGPMPSANRFDMRACMEIGRNDEQQVIRREHQME